MNTITYTDGENWTAIRNIRAFVLGIPEPARGEIISASRAGDKALAFTLLAPYVEQALFGGLALPARGRARRTLLH